MVQQSRLKGFYQGFQQLILAKKSVQEIKEIQESILASINQTNCPKFQAQQHSFLATTRWQLYKLKKQSK